MTTRTGLMVIDVQTCYLEKYKDQKMVEDCINTINSYTSTAHKKNIPIIYIEHEFKGFFTRLFMQLCQGGMGINGSKKFPTDNRINILTYDMALKSEGNSFSSSKVLKWIKDHKINELLICGQDGAHCVNSTAIGALELKLKTVLLENAIISTNMNKWCKKKESLINSGAEFKPDI
ncbi:MAG: isochorismatase family protein [Bacteriovoracaceae bacterium]|jgi:nicotinamidase-related amidase|nr:isochorismatase family protein [Bacteriovoracaceae bacterium]